MIAGIARVLRNSALSLVADAVARASNTVLFILISRQLGAAEGGAYALALTYTLLFTQLSFWGMDQLLTREVAKDHAAAGRFTGNFILIRLALSLVLFLVMALLVGRVLGYAPSTARVILIVGLSIVPESISNICQSVFIAFEQIKYSTLVGTVVGTLRLAGGGLILLSGGRVEAIAVLLCLSSLIGLMLNLGIIYLRFPRPHWRLDIGFWLPQLGAAFPFILIGVFYIIEFQSDTLLLSVLRSEKDIGLYNAATTILFALALVPQAFRAAIFPMMSRLYATASSSLAVVYEKSFKYLLVISLPVAAALTLSADVVIRLLFCSGFDESAAVLQIVIWTFVLMMINVPSARMMVVANAQDKLALFQGLSMSLNLCLNVWLIPQWGAAGAAWARVGSTGLFVALGAIYTYWKLNRWNPFHAITRPLIALGAMLALWYLLRGVNSMVAVCGGLAGYAAFVWWSDVISPDERAILAQVLRRRPAQEVVTPGVIKQGK